MNGGYLGEFTFSKGKVNLTITSLTYGNKTVTVVYSGNYKYLSKNVTKTFKVDKINPDLKVKIPSKVNVGDEIKISPRQIVVL